MSPFWNRRGEEPGKVQEISPEDPTPSDLGVVTPEDFVRGQHENLAASAFLWSQIAERAREFNNPAQIERLRQGMLDSAPANERDHWLMTVSEHDAKRLGADLALYSLVTLREISSRVSGTFSIAKEISRNIRAIPDKGLYGLIHDTIHQEIIAGQSSIVMNMRQADGISEEVLSALVATYQCQPDGIAALSACYKNPAAKQDPDFSELQKMIASDWHQPDASRSLLRDFCSRLRDDDAAHLEAFLRKVESEPGNRRYAAVDEMARFAMAASGVDAPDVPLRRTFGQWHSYEQLEAAFQAFKAEEVRAVEAGLNSIAGYPLEARQSIRIPRTAADVQAARDMFSLYFTDRRTRKKTKNGRTAMYLPTIKEVDKEASAIEAVQPKRQLMVAKALPKGQYAFQEIDVDNLKEALNLNGDLPFNADVKAMVEAIVKNPFGQGTQKLRKRMRVIGPDGSQLSLRRFSPLEKQGLTVHSNHALRTRVVYGVSQTELVLLDVLHHEQFDKKYRV